MGKTDLQVDEFGARLRYMRELRGMSREDLASKLDTSRTSIENYESGRLPKGDILMKMIKALGCSADWLLFGGQHAQCQIENQQSQSESFVYVKKVKARLSAGNGSLETDSELDGYHAFQERWIMRMGNPSRMVLMDVAGDSMSPVLEDGDTVLIDESKTEIIAGKIYAVAIDDEILVKRLDKRPGLIVLRSENHRYEALEINPADENVHFKIIGKIIWWCRVA